MNVQDDIERKLANQDMTIKAKLEEILQKDQKIASLENEVKNLQQVITSRDAPSMPALPLLPFPHVPRWTPQPTPVFGIHNAPRYGYPNWWYSPPRPIYYSARPTYHHH